MTASLHRKEIWDTFGKCSAVCVCVCLCVFVLCYPCILLSYTKPLVGLVRIPFTHTHTHTYTHTSATTRFPSPEPLELTLPSCSTDLGSPFWSLSGNLRQKKGFSITRYQYPGPPILRAHKKYLLLGSNNNHMTSNTQLKPQFGKNYLNTLWYSVTI